LGRVRVLGSGPRLHMHMHMRTHMHVHLHAHVHVHVRLRLVSYVTIDYYYLRSTTYRERGEATA
jgi:hypothetical protein